MFRIGCHRLIGAAVAAALAVSGCSGGDAAGPATTTTTVASSVDPGAAGESDGVPLGEEFDVPTFTQQFVEAMGAAGVSGGVPGVTEVVTKFATCLSGAPGVDASVRADILSKAESGAFFGLLEEAGAEADGCGRDFQTELLALR